MLAAKSVPGSARVFSGLQLPPWGFNHAGVLQVGRNQAARIRQTLSDAAADYAVKGNSRTTANSYCRYSVSPRASCAVRRGKSQKRGVAEPVACPSINPSEENGTP